MAEYIIGAVNWSDQLAIALRKAQTDDTVIVRTEPMMQLAQRAAQRMGKTGVRIVIADELSD